MMSLATNLVSILPGLCDRGFPAREEDRRKPASFWNHESRLRECEMKSKMRILATKCHTSSCCPTVMLSEDGSQIVIVGDSAHPLLWSAQVMAKVGENEASIVIPRDLLLEAVNALRG
jgi:hypothetical protein